MRLIDLTKRKFGRLTVVGRAKFVKGRAKWLCKCTCGTEKLIAGQSLSSSQTVSCGCYGRSHKGALKHGLSTSRTYQCWASMCDRCNNKNNTSYKNYGGRGITVCKRWLKFENFLADMGVRPMNLTLERKNNEKGYRLGNCEWATYQKQRLNQRARGPSPMAVVLTYNGISKTCREWDAALGFKFGTVKGRRQRGLSVVQTLTLPKQYRPENA